MTKIGRNEPCPCASGKKYKHCHGRVGTWPIGSAILPEGVRASLERQEAQEHVRAAQQGHGRPIISAKLGEHQVVAVRNQLHASKTWKTFIDFLGDFLKVKLTSDWGNAEIKKPLEARHTIMQWYDTVCRVQAKSITKPNEPASMEVIGVLACYYGLSYALYLIEHNVELQNRMIFRLKDRSNFQGAYYELMVARVLIAAGFDLTLEDEGDRSSQHCEFAAISKETGQKFWIEAKMRSVAGLLGKNATDGVNAKTAENPISHLVPHLNAALRKPADDQRMIFIDLNAAMSAEVSDQNPPMFIDAVNRRLLKYEKETLERGKTAYVFVTNMTFHRDLLGRAQIVAIPLGVGIPDFNRTGQMKLTEIFRRDKKHADALRVGESIKQLLSFPTTFDGTMMATALFGERPPIQIGEKYNFEGAGPGGVDVVGTVTDAIVLETKKEVMVAINTEDDKAYLLHEKMTDTQFADYKAHPDAYFGKIKHVPKSIESPYDMFLFFVEGQKGMKRPKLLEHMNMSEEQAEGLSDEDLLLEYCERQVSGSGLFDTVDGVLRSNPTCKGQ
jgi:hypothetical protein